MITNPLILNELEPTLYNVVPKVIIAGRTNSTAVSPRLDEHTELGWEVVYTHLKIKYLLHKGIINSKTIIVTVPGREFLYNKVFETVLTSEPQTKKPILDLTRELQRYSTSPRSIKYLSFQSPDHKCIAKYNFESGYDLRSTINLPIIRHEPGYICATYRKREWGSQRNADSTYFLTLLELAKRHIVYLVGLESKPFCNGTTIIYTPLAEWLSLSTSQHCKAVIGTATGTMLLVWLLSNRPFYILDYDNCISNPNCCLHFRKENSFYGSTINKSFTKSLDFYNSLYQL